MSIWRHVFHRLKQKYSKRRFQLLDEGEMQFAEVQRQPQETEHARIKYADLNGYRQMKGLLHIFARSESKCIPFEPRYYIIKITQSELE